MYVDYKAEITPLVVSKILKIYRRVSSGFVTSDEGRKAL